MSNELVQSGVAQQDIENINNILKMAGNALPIQGEGYPETPPLPVTEEFLAGINARKKRLQIRNLLMDIKIPYEKKMDDETAKSEDIMAVLEEGMHRSGYLEKRWHQTTTYWREQKEVSVFYDVNTLSYYICKDTDGRCKVSSVYTKRLAEYFDREKERTDVNMQEVAKIVVSFLTVLIFGSTSVSMVISCIETLLGTTYWKDILVLLFVMIAFGGFFGSIAMLGVSYLVKRPFYKKKRILSRKVTARLLEAAPEFYLEKFLGILNSKLLRLLYADDTEEIGDIVSCDMARFLQDHGDVVDCEFRNFWFTDMREDKDYMYLDVVYKVNLYRDMGTKIKRHKQMIYMQLARPICGIMESDLYHDWSIIKIETLKKK